MGQECVEAERRGEHKLDEEDVVRSLLMNKRISMRENGPGRGQV